MEKLLEKVNNKKLIENLVIFLILAIIVMIVINSLFSGDDQENKNSVLENSVMKVEQSSSNSENMEERLEKILSLISGAGKVEVMISYLNETSKIPMTDTKVTTTVVSEKDSNGGERKTEETNTEETIIYEQDSSNKIPVIKQSVLPEVVGVIVVAEGANNLTVKENLIKAVEAVVNVPSHRVQVFSR